jgi:hypothetical protein
MTVTPSTEQTRRPEEEIVATGSSTEQAPAVDAGGCDCGCACCTPGNAGTVPAEARAGCGCGCG